MSEEMIQKNLFVELSAESQELVSGGQTRTPDITVVGVLRDSRGQRIPVTILGFITGQPTGGGGGGLGGF